MVRLLNLLSPDNLRLRVAVGEGFVVPFCEPPRTCLEVRPRLVVKVPGTSVTAAPGDVIQTPKLYLSALENGMNLCNLINGCRQRTQGRPRWEVPGGIGKDPFEMWVFKVSQTEHLVFVLASPL